MKVRRSTFARLLTLGRVNPLIKIHRFPISLDEYYVRGKLNLFPELYGCPHPGCPYRDRLRKHGFYSRHAITPCEVYVVWIQRYLCPLCGRTVSLLPSFLAPHFQYALAAVFWILDMLHRLKLSTRAVVETWHRSGHAPEFSRQHIQFVQRRLRHNAPAYRLFLHVGDDRAIGSQLVEHLPRFGSVDRLAERFYTEWQRPLLSQL